MCLEDRGLHLGVLCWVCGQIDSCRCGCLGLASMLPPRVFTEPVAVCCCVAVLLCVLCGRVVVWLCCCVALWSCAFGLLVLGTSFVVSLAASCVCSSRLVTPV